MKVAYDPEKYRQCLLCSRERELDLFISAMQGMLEYGTLHGKQMDLMFNNASDAQRRELSAQSDDIVQKILKDLKDATDIRKATYG